MRNKLRGTNIIRTRKVWIFEGNEDLIEITLVILVFTPAVTELYKTITNFNHVCCQ